MFPIICRIESTSASSKIGDGLFHFVVGELVVGIVHREPLQLLAVGPVEEYGGNGVDVQLLESVAEILVQQDVGEGRLLLLEELLGLGDGGLSAGSSSESEMTASPLGPYFRCISTTWGKFSLQGPQVVDQASTIVYLTSWGWPGASGTGSS